MKITRAPRAGPSRARVRNARCFECDLFLAQETNVYAFRLSRNISRPWLPTLASARCRRSARTLRLRPPRSVCFGKWIRLLLLSASADRARPNNRSARASKLRQFIASRTFSDSRTKSLVKSDCRVESDPAARFSSPHANANTQLQRRRLEHFRACAHRSECEKSIFCAGETRTFRERRGEEGLQWPNASIIRKANDLLRCSRARERENCVCDSVLPGIYDSCICAALSRRRSGFGLIWCACSWACSTPFRSCFCIIHSAVLHFLVYTSLFVAFGGSTVRYRPLALPRSAIERNRTEWLLAFAAKRNQRGSGVFSADCCRDGLRRFVEPLSRRR